MVLGVGVAGAIFTTVLTHAGLESEAGALFRAVQAGLLAAVAFAALSAITSAARGKASFDA
jgi:hypothetical protein